MNRRWSAILVLVWWIALFAWGIHSWVSRVPTYQGKSANAWFAEYARTMTAGEETTSLNALRALGPAAVPVLLNAVYANDTGLKRFELFIWTQLPVIIKSRLLAPIPAAQRLVRMGVVKTLGQLGSEAKPAVPALTRLLEETSDEPLRRALVHALLIIEPGNPRPVEAE